MSSAQAPQCNSSCYGDVGVSEEVPNRIKLAGIAAQPKRKVVLFDHRYDPQCYVEQVKKGRDWILVGQIPLGKLNEAGGREFDFEFLEATDANLDVLVQGSLVLAHLRLDQVYLLKTVHTTMIEKDQVFILVTSTEGYNSDVYASYVRATNGKRAVFLFVRDMKRVMEPTYLRELLSLDVDRAIGLMKDPESPFRPCLELHPHDAVV